MRSIQELESKCKELTQYFSSIKTLNPAVSNATIGWHIDHSFKVINKITDSLENSNPLKYKWIFNIKRFVVFFKNEIPRGVGKAPKQVQSYNEVILDDIKSEQQKLIVSIEVLKKCVSKVNFNHPIFGMLNKNNLSVF